MAACCKRRFVRHAVLGIMSVLGAVSASGQSEAARVAIIFGAKSPYRTASEALSAQLTGSGHQTTSLELPAGDGGARQDALRRALEFKPTIIATGGADATTLVLENTTDVPVVFFMVPNALNAPFMARGGLAQQRLAGVTSDIDPATQMDWIVRMHSSARNIAVLCSPRSQRTTAALVEAGRRRGVSVVPVLARRDEFPKAIEALNQSQSTGVVMIPDADVYNSPNVQRLLLWGLRQKKPVWTFSPNVVKAGAFAGFYCDSAEVGKQAAEIVRQIVQGKKPGGIGLQYAHTVGTGVNAHTAEMIGARLDESVFGADVERLGSQP